MIDDAGGDATAEVLQRWVDARGIHNVSVFRNPVNQGYGGNQKLGYRQALEGGFDFTILLHGDGQYAPELLPKFIEVWERTGADVVLGSRMGSLRSARAGGMPLYKMAGNRILTVIQNYLTGLRLSEYHTGFRAYSSELSAQGAVRDQHQRFPLRHRDPASGRERRGQDRGVRHSDPLR